jgi:hypothetical protein
VVGCCECGDVLSGSCATEFTNGVFYTLEVTEYFLYTMSLACDILHTCSNASTVYVMLNANNLLRINTIFTQYAANTISALNTNNATTLANMQQVNEADWLTRPRDSRCAEPSKPRPSSCVPVTSVTLQPIPPRRMLFVVQPSHNEQNQNHLYWSLAPSKLTRTICASLGFRVFAVRRIPAGVVPA